MFFTLQWKVLETPTSTTKPEDGARATCRLMGRCGLWGRKSEDSRIVLCLAETASFTWLVPVGYSSVSCV